MNTPGPEHDPRHELSDLPADMEGEMDQARKARRDFLKLSGLAGMATVLASCAADQRKAAPLVHKPEQTPGVAYWYASTCQGCNAGCGALMKVRDGRPLKAEGNPEHPLSRGGLCARGQGMIVSLYDSDRLRGPRLNQNDADWAALDAEVIKALGSAQGSVRLLTGAVNGPAANAVVSSFLAAWPGAKHVTWDAVSSTAIAAAHHKTHGEALTPGYHIERADVIVSFGADFLGAWLSPVEFARQWGSRRSLTGENRVMNRHIQLEARMSLTGANADTRYRLPDSERGAALVALAVAVARLAGTSAPFDAASSEALPAAEVDKIARELWAAKGKSLVLCGADDEAQQVVVNYLNHLLGNYGATLDLSAPSQQQSSDGGGMAQLLADMEAGKVSVLVIDRVNPAYALPDAARLVEALKKVKFTVAIADREDETASLCTAVAPPHHSLESWDDFEPRKGLYGLSQPGIRPLYKTRQAQTSLLAWAKSDQAKLSYHAVIRKHWEEKGILAGQSWSRAVEMGFVATTPAQRFLSFSGGSVTKAVGTEAVGKKPGEGFEICVHESLSMGDGRHANNAWLQEMPDPLTKVCWDNGVCLSPAAMNKLGLEAGDLVKLDAEVEGRTVSLELPAIRQPGQADNTAVVALGYGREKAGSLKHGMGVEEGAIGGNAFPLLSRTGVVSGTLAKAGGRRELALSQTHDSQEGRPIAKETTFADWSKNPRAGNEEPREYWNIWKSWDYKGHRWGMVVNLNACIGCSGCVVSCNLENNIPVVGRDEVRRRREMHWLRIDRYYQDDDHDGELTTHENPSVTFQPMMCAHCENAPCETVCPVAATTHSGEGLNTQAYNRCVGTRYCANNCPYKVRRFNWFDYKHDDPTLNLLLNPEITIRSRGIMEKCTMCSQRLYDGKREAAREGRKLRDEDLTTACQQSCPTQAIVVGDLNDPASLASKLARNARNYPVLAEVGIKPAVTYLTKVRNEGPSAT